MDQQEEYDVQKLNGLHYYLCSRNFNLNFDENQDDININIEEQAEMEDEQIDQIFEKNNEQKQVQKKEQKQLPKIPLTFIDSEDYITTFEQHLFHEAKAQILKAKITESSKPEKVRLIQVDLINKNQQNQTQEQNQNNNGFQKGNFYKFRMQKLEQNDNIYMIHDFCILTQNKISQNDEQVGDHLLGLIEKQDGDHIIIKVIFQEMVNQKIKVTWYLQKFCRIVTAEREYEALQNFENISFHKQFLNPAQQIQNYQKTEYFEIPSKLEQKLINSYNESQIVAIKETLKTSGITLIQGPPGTGKTTTVIGTISVLLNSLNKQFSLQEQQKIYKTQLNDTQKEEFNMDKAMPWTRDGYIDWRDEIFECNDDLMTLENIQKNRPFLYHKTEQIIANKIDQKQYQPPEKILICGPSNASIDEIIRKLLEKKLLDKNGNQYDPKKLIVRVGENYDSQLKEFSLEFLCKQLMSEKNMKEDQQNEAKKMVLNRCKIVCSTLSSSGSQILQISNLAFDTVIIDEAAQAVECSILIPLQYQCKRLILIGDQKQLPATIFSKTCEKFGYSQSLFERLEKNGYPIHMLKIQYRMHPNISRFISKAFYNEELKDYDQILDLIGNPPLYNQHAFKPLVFFHVNGAEKFEHNSFKNDKEAQVILEIYKQMKQHVKGLDIKTQVGIITPYAQQVKNIRKVIKTFDETEKCEIEVNSVDGYQGREKDIIIFSTVRASKVAHKSDDPNNDLIKGNTKQSIGFLNDPRRMNVSLSRARICLIVIGDINQLQYHIKWRTLLSLSVYTSACFKFNDPFTSFFNRFSADQNQMLVRDFDKYNNGKDAISNFEKNQSQQNKNEENEKIQKEKEKNLLLLLDKQENKEGMEIEKTNKNKKQNQKQKQQDNDNENQTEENQIEEEEPEEEQQNVKSNKKNSKKNTKKQSKKKN